MAPLAGLVPLLVLGAIVWGAIAAVRGFAGSGGREPVDAAAALKSAVIHVGLFVALIAVTVGLIDLLQLAVADEQIAGSSAAAARALSLLIVGVPAYLLLLRVVRQRNRERADSGDPRPPRGWSAYLVAALATLLIGSLVSVAQVTETLTDASDEFDPEQVMQLIAWLAVWAVHWFVLRPRFGVRGAVHLAVGSIIGLAWMLGGVGAVIYRVLAGGYNAAFDDTLAGDFDTTFWLVIGLVGIAVWGWHWHGHFNRAQGGHRRSPLWFFTVVVAGVLPGLLAMLISVTAMVSGVLIWFLGTTDESAVDFFEPATAMIALLFVGLVSWAYHRWELERDGVPTRNESLRFHDYAVVAVTLIGVVVAVAAIIGLMIDTLSIGDGFAGSLEATNSLIISVTVLAACAAVWWSQWSRVERALALHPVAESDSLWRKLYLIAAFGLGGLVLGISLIWLLFAVLRDVLDGALGRDTLADLTWPIGWSVAVVGAVWYHLDIWRVDRATLATHAPVPPPPQAQGPPPPQPGTGPLPSGVVLRPATVQDHGELFTLQRAAFVDEAIAYGTVDVPSLSESFDELQRRLASSQTLVAVAGERLVGAVSARRWRDGGPDIERLMVAPDRRRGGVATALLDEIERRLVSEGETSVQLIVGEPVAQARALYADQGYEQVAREQTPGGPVLITLRKDLA